MRRLWLPALVSRPREPATLKQGETMRRFTLLVVIAALTVGPAAAARADAVAHPSGSERNFVALLRPVSAGPPTPSEWCSSGSRTTPRRSCFSTSGRSG